MGFLNKKEGFKDLRAVGFVSEQTRSDPVYPVIRANVFFLHVHSPEAIPSNFFSISTAPVSNLEKANHFLPRSFRDAPM